MPRYISNESGETVFEGTLLAVTAETTLTSSRAMFDFGRTFVFTWNLTTPEECKVNRGEEQRGSVGDNRSGLIFWSLVYMIYGERYRSMYDACLGIKCICFPTFPLFSLITSPIIIITE